MSLRKKTLLVVGATLFGLVAGLYGATSTILLGSFKKAEAQNTRQLVQEVLGVFAQTQADFKDRFVDWAAWDDTYRFIQDRNAKYIQSNLNSESLAALKINLIVYVNRSGSIVFGTGFDSKNHKLKPIPNLIKQYLSSPEPLLAHAKLDSYTTGILLLPEGPMVIASLPIITSRKTGPIRGTLIFGRYLDENEINKLSQTTRTHLSLYKLHRSDLSEELQKARNGLINGSKQKPKGAKIYHGECSISNAHCSILVRPLSEKAIAGYSIIHDMEGKPILLLRVKVFREIYRQGQSSQGYLIASVIVVGLLFGGVTLLLLEKLVLSRLARLGANLNQIGQSSDLSARLSIDGRDELSNLANQINQMLATVENSQRQLQESEELHRAVVEQIAEGIYLVDVESHRIIEANTALSQLLGYSLSELLEINLYDLIDSDRAIIDQTIQQVLQDKHGSIRESRYRRRDRSLLDVEVSVSLVSYGGREVLCIVVRDITQRKRAEVALRQAEEKYRQIFENATEGIYQITPDGSYISANPMLARIYGYSCVEALMANITHIGEQLYVNPRRYKRFLADIAKQDAVFKSVAQIYRPDRSTIWIAETVRAIRDEWGNLLYYEGIVEDVTTRKIMEEALHYQREQAERLLLNILPDPIASRLRLEESTIADSFAEVTVLFADIVGFTQLASEIPPTELVELLNEIFSAFDQLADEYGVEKIKTIGDAYMVAGGLPIPRPDHAEAIAEMALEMQRAITQFTTAQGHEFTIRIGIHTGPVIAGVIGIKRFIYDLWGDTVNIASRMESHGVPGCIQVTDATYERLRDKYIFQQRGVIQVKGKGEMMTYLLVGRQIPAIASTPSPTISS